jgi:hypothetical protein
VKNTVLNICVSNFRSIDTQRVGMTRPDWVILNWQTRHCTEINISAVSLIAMTLKLRHRHHSFIGVPGVPGVQPAWNKALHWNTAVFTGVPGVPGKTTYPRRMRGRRRRKKTAEAICGNESFCAGKKRGHYCI